MGSEVLSSFLIEIYDVKFYPYGKPTDDPIFAAVGGKKVSFTITSVSRALINFHLQLLVCRTTHAKERKVETIQAVLDESVCINR